MALTKINVGTSANDGTGSTLRVAFQRTNLAMDAVDAIQTKIDGIEAGADVTDATNVAAAITGSTEATSPTNTDKIPWIVSALGWVTWANLKSFLKTYFDTLYPAISHASSHVTGGSDKIRDATASQDGLATAAQITKLDGIESSADVTDSGNVGSSIHGAAAKTTPVDADTFPLIDSAASNALKKVTWANLKATLRTAFDSVYQAAGSYLTSGGALGTPSSGTLTSCTGLPVTTGLTAGNWKVFYSNGSGTPVELALGADGTYLKSNGASSAPSFATPSGGGGSTKQFAGSDTQYTFTTETWEDINLSLSVTVTTGQKVLIRGIVQIATPGNACIAGMRLMRDSTPIGVGTPTGSRLAVGAQAMSTSDYGAGTAVSEHVDEPSAGTYTYKVQARLMTGAGGAVYINRTGQNTDADYQGAARSTLFTEVY